MESRIDRIKKQLHGASYKLTPQREATVRVLLENEEDHLSAEDVYLFSVVCSLFARDIQVDSFEMWCALCVDQPRAQSTKNI